MSRDPSCIFCKILDGQVPCARVYEDDACLCFVDIGPLADGHLLIIPRNHYARLHEMPVAELTGLTAALARLTQAMLSVTGASAYNLLQNNGPESGQVVEHVHFHLIPRKANDGLGYRWNAGTYPQGRAEELARAISDAFSRQS